MSNIVTGATVLDFSVESSLHDHSKRMIVRLLANSTHIWMAIRSQINYRTASGQPIVDGSLIKCSDAKRTQHLVHYFKTLKLIECSYGLGFWVHDTSDNSVFWSEGLYGLLQLDRSHFSPARDSLTEYCEPNLSQALAASFTQALEAGVEPQLAESMKTSDDSSIDVSITIRLVDSHTLGRIERG